MIPIKDNVPTRTFPLVTVLLIATNLGVWIFYELPEGTVRSAFQLGFEPCEIQHACTDRGVPYPADAITAMFAHASWLHILGNMLFLWIFGNNVEDAMGRARYLVFYLLAGIVATASQSWATLSFGSPHDTAVPNLGASGAIAGVLGAYLVLLPAARVIAFVPLFFFLLPVELPAVLFLGLWFVFQLSEAGFSLVVPQAGGGIAFFAHIGGFLFGILTVHAFARRRARAPAWY
ncbi:MAG: rhomboid family intramembrane serine protease [Gaiellaceae bacterium]